MQRARGTQNLACVYFCFKVGSVFMVKTKPSDDRGLMNYSPFAQIHHDYSVDIVRLVHNTNNMFFLTPSEAKMRLSE